MLFRDLNPLSETSNAELLFNKLTLEFDRKMQSAYDCSIVGMGGGGDEDGMRLLSIHFSCSRKMTLNETRQMFICSIKDFLNAINSSEEVRPFLKTYPFTIKNLKIMITFLDKNYKKPQKPFIASVHHNDNVIFFEQDSDLFDSYELISKELFEDAEKIVAETLTTDPSPKL